MMQGIWVILCFQCYTTAFTIVNSVLTGFIQEIAGIELNAGTIGIYRHAASRYRVLQDRTRIAEDLPVVIITTLKKQRLIVGIDILTNGLGGAEIHWRSGYFAQFTGGNIFCIVGAEETTGNRQNLIHGGVCLFMTCKIEITVVCQIKDSILIRNRIIDDVQCTFTVQFVGHPDNGISRETLITIGTVKLKGYGRICMFYGLPDSQVEEIRATM